MCTTAAEPPKHGCHVQENTTFWPYTWQDCDLVRAGRRGKAEKTAEYCGEVRAFGRSCL